MASRGRHAGTPARRQQILDAALALFAEGELAGVTVESLCYAAGCSVGSLYHHFGSKEGVTGALFLDGLQSINEGLLRRLADCRSAQQGVETVVGHYIDWVEANPAWARFLMSYRDLRLTEAGRAELRQVQEGQLGAVFQWFAPYVMAGEMKALPPATYIPIISAPVEDYVRLWLAGRTDTPPNAVRSIFAAAAWAGVAP